MTLSVFEAEKFKRLSPQQQLAIRTRMRDRAVKSPKFKMMPASGRAKVLRMFGSFMEPPSVMEKVEGALFEGLRQLAPKTSLDETAAIASSLTRTPGVVGREILRSASLGLINPEEEPVPEAVAARLDPIRNTTQLIAGLAPIMGSAKAVGWATRKGVELGAPAVLASRPVQGALTLGIPSAIGSGGHQGEVMKSLMVGALSGFAPATAGILGPLIAGGIMAGAETAIPAAGEEIGVDLGHKPSLGQIAQLAILPLALHAPQRTTNAKVEGTPKINLWPQGDWTSPRQVTRPEYRPSEVSPPRESPIPKRFEPTFKAGATVETMDFHEGRQVRPFQGTVRDTVWDITRATEVVTVVSPRGQTIQLPVRVLQTPSTTPPPPDIPKEISGTRRVDLIMGEDGIRRTREAQHRNDLPRTKGEYRGVLDREKAMRESIALIEDIRMGRRKPVKDIDDTNEGLAQRRTDLNRIVKRRKTIERLAGTAEEALTKAEVQEVLNERIRPTYDAVRDVDGERAGNVQAAQRQVEGTAKEPGAPIESYSKAIRPGPVRHDRYTEDTNSVVYEDPRPTIPEKVEVPRMSRPLNQTVIDPPAMLLNPEIQIAMKKAYAGQFTPEVQNMLNFRVNWNSPAELGYTLEQIGFPSETHVRLTSIMEKLVPGWTNTPTPGTERQLATEATLNPAAEKVASIPSKPEGTPALISPESGDVGRIASRPTPESVETIIRSQLPAPMQTNPLTEGTYALNQRKIALNNGRISELRGLLEEAISANESNEVGAGRRVRELRDTIGELRNRTTMLERTNETYGQQYDPEGTRGVKPPVPPVTDTDALLDTFETHLRDLPVERVRSYLKDPTLDVAMKKRVKNIIAELSNSKAFTEAEQAELERLEPRTKWIRKGIERVATSEEAQDTLARQLGVPGSETLVTKRGKALRIGSGFEVKEIVRRDEPAPEPPSEMYALNDRGTKLGLKSYAQNMGLDVKLTEGGYEVDGHTVRTLKDVNTVLQQFFAVKNTSTVGAKKYEPPEGVPRPPPRRPEPRETRTPPGAQTRPDGTIRFEQLNPRLVNVAAADRGATIDRVDGGWILRNFPEQTQRFYPEDPSLSRNGWDAAVEGLLELPVRRGPDLGPGSIGGQAPPRIPLARGPHPGGDPYPAHVPSTDNAGLPLMAKWKPTHAVMQLIEQELKFPVWSKVMSPVEDATAAGDHWVKPWHRTTRQVTAPIKKGEMEAVQDYISTPKKWQAATAARWQMRPPVRRAADNLEKLWRKLLTEELELTNHGAENFLKDYMPRMKRAQGDIDIAFPNYSLPKELTQWGEYFRKGDIQLHGSHALQNINAMVRMTAYKKYMEPIWDDVRAVVDAQRPNPLDPGKKTYVMPEMVRKVVNSYLDAVRNMPHESVGVVDDAIKAAFRRLGIKKQVTRDQRHRMVNMFMSAHYGGTMWFRPALAMRNLGQSTLVIPEIGVRAWAEGLKRASTPKGWRKSMDALKLTPFKQAAVPWELEAYDLPGGFWRRLQSGGMFLYRGADAVNRSVSYHAAEWAIENYGKQYAQGKITKNAFLHKTGLAKQYQPTKDAVLQHIEGRAVPNLEAAMQEYGKQIVRNTQYTYRRGNEPLAFRGVWGRMFGQYGIWPANFLELMHRNTIGKTGANAYQRAAWIAKMAGVWTAMELALEEGAGVDASRWTWINPFAFQGGPMFQALTTAYKMAGGTDFEKGMAKARMERIAYTFMPFYLAYRDHYDALTESDNPREQLIRSLGFQPVDPDEKNFLLQEVPEKAKGGLEALQDLTGGGGHYTFGAR